jgi:hypothetical protein
VLLCDPPAAAQATQILQACISIADEPTFSSSLKHIGYLVSHLTSNPVLLTWSSVSQLLLSHGEQFSELVPCPVQDFYLTWCPVGFINAYFCKILWVFRNSVFYKQSRKKGGERTSIEEGANATDWQRVKKLKAFARFGPPLDKPNKQNWEQSPKAHLTNSHRRRRLAFSSAAPSPAVPSARRPPDKQQSQMQPKQKVA